MDIDASMHFSHYFWDIDVFLKYLEILQYFFKSDPSLTHLVLEMLTHLKISDSNNIFLFLFLTHSLKNEMKFFKDKHNNNTIF